MKDWGKELAFWLLGTWSQRSGVRDSGVRQMNERNAKAGINRLAITMGKWCFILPDSLGRLMKHVSELFTWKTKGRWFYTLASVLQLLSVTSWTWTSPHYQVIPVWLAQGNKQLQYQGGLLGSSQDTCQVHLCDSCQSQCVSGWCSKD